MSRLPKVLDDRRGWSIALIATLATGQAAAAGVAAFATRDVFSAMGGVTMPVFPLLTIGAAGLAIALLRIGERIIAEDLGHAYAAAVRSTLFEHAMRMSTSDVARRRAGDLSIRFVGDLTAVRSWVSLGIARLVSAAIILPGATAALFFLNPALAASAGLPLILAVTAMATMAPGLGPLHRRLRNRRAKLAADMAERMPVAPELRLLGRGTKETDRLARRSQSLKSAAIARIQASSLLRAVPDIGSSLAGVSILVTGFLTGAAAAEAAAALATLAILSLPLRDLANIWDRHRAWQVARGKCEAILASPLVDTEIQSAGTGLKRPPKLEFLGAAVAGLEALSAVVQPGEKIAIMGPNGSGKSTLLALAAGLEAPDKGTVAADDLPVTRLPPANRRQSVFYVGQRSPILMGSLRRALSLGCNPRPNDSLIARTAEIYGLGSLLDDLGGLDGRIAEGGRNLSSGQARRVQLVRAALANPFLLLLDEPEEALDSTGHACVEQLIDQTLATTLIVTHDRRLADMADRIWWLEGGSIRAVNGPPDRDGDRPSVNETPDRRQVS